MAADRRRLVAILAADVVGYSRLIGVDEAGALNRRMAERLAIEVPLGLFTRADQLIE